ncbi:MAG: flippase, partial [Chloroflexota bacterium]
WLSLGYYGLIFANLLGILLMAFLCWRGVHRLGVRAQRPRTTVWPRLLRASIPFGIIGFTLGLSYKLDSVLLNIFRGDTETGYYNAVYNLVFSAAILSNALNTALYPSL